MKRFLAHCIAGPWFVSWYLFAYPVWFVLYLLDDRRPVVRFYGEFVDLADDVLDHLWIGGRVRKYRDSEIPRDRIVARRTICPVCAGQGERLLLNGSTAPCTECGGSRFVNAARDAA